jgi:hypothetical protein
MRLSCHQLGAASRGAGNSGAPNRLWLSSSLNTCQGVIVTITDRMAAWRRERRVLARVSRAAWRLEQAERERAWALASARAEGVAIRTLAAAAGLSPARVHQVTAQREQRNAQWRQADLDRRLPGDGKPAVIYVRDKRHPNRPEPGATLS